MSGRERWAIESTGSPVDGPPGAAGQLRIDTWSRLKTLSGQLAGATRRGSESSSDPRDDLHLLTRRTRLSKGALIDRLDLRGQIRAALELLRPLEFYHAFPGKGSIDDLLRLLDGEEFGALAQKVARLERARAAGDCPGLDPCAAEADDAGGEVDARPPRSSFEVLVVDHLPPDEEAEIRRTLLELRRDTDPFVYAVVVVPSFEDAIIACLVNDQIQSCLIGSHFPFHSSVEAEVLRCHLASVDRSLMRDDGTSDPSILLARAIKRVRRELDLFWVTDTPVEEVAGDLGPCFRRVFYGHEDWHELHLSILQGIGERYEAPFFNALRVYSQRPAGGFHALPLSRGKSIANSHWIRDMGEFFGENLFLAETSATGGGLDSLLQPRGPLKRAQELAARAFGARRTFFVTNGTSTANKIVVQALVSPGDIVLLARDCHKSHHYALMLVGAHPLYLDPYPLSEISVYGAVELATIKRALLALRRAGKLDRVRMLLLTSCTFDGIIYDPIRVMHEVLAIKPDIVFLWDEAWFGHGGLVPMMRSRTAMAAASRLRERYRSDEYRRRFETWTLSAAAGSDEAALLDGSAMPDPDAVRVRVYATQSTHKTLTALRQGSMIHVHDQDFAVHASEPFAEAYMTHTSTSPSYQVLASLDVGRRQAELEGYGLVQRSIHLAMSIRQRISQHPLLRKYFCVLGPREMIPREHRPSGLESYPDPQWGARGMHEAFRVDELALDPTRVTLHVGRVGINGDTLRRRLMEEFDIQINKTSRNTLLFMIHIGVTRGTVAYLIEVLTRIAEELELAREEQGRLETETHHQSVRALTHDLLPLPRFSRFHPRFAAGETAEGDMRAAFFLANRSWACEFLKLGGPIERQMAGGREIVSAGFVTPYPPGVPLLVPGQVVMEEIVAYLAALDVHEIHGYDPHRGLRVFTQAALAEPERPSCIEGDALAGSELRPTPGAVDLAGD